MMLTSACLALYDTADDIQVHMPYTMSRLKEHLRARQTTPPLHPCATAQHEGGDASVSSMDARSLGQSLARLTNDAIEAYALTPGSAWGIALELTADVLAMFFHQRQHTLVELEALIDETLQPVMLRHMRQAQRETGHRHQYHRQQKQQSRLKKVVEAKAKVTQLFASQPVRNNHERECQHDWNRDEKPAAAGY